MNKLAITFIAAVLLLLVACRGGNNNGGTSNGDGNGIGNVVRDSGEGGGGSEGAGSAEGSEGAGSGEGSVNTPARTYDVTFYSSADEGAKTAVVSIEEGKTISAGEFPNSLAEDPGGGLTVIAWSPDKTGTGAVVDEITVINADISLYPVWGKEISDINDIRNDPKGKYKLTADVDLKGANWDPIGEPVENCFKGTLYGDGHVISGLKLPAEMYSGLFKCIDGAHISNLHIELAPTTLNMTDSSAIIGGLAAGAINASVINGVSVSGDITLNIAGGVYAGLIFGVADGFSTIKDSYSTGDISVNGSAHLYAGGIVGYVQQTIVTSCYALGDINVTSTGGDSAAGGIAGGAANNANINNNVVISKNIAGFYSGRILGYNFNANSADNYALEYGQLAATVKGDDGISSDTADIAFFKKLGWDFDDVWTDVKEGKISPYPVLKR